MEAAGRRYVGIDLGKRTYTLAIIGKKGAVTLSNGTTALEGRIALYKKLEKTDRVAVEAGNPAFGMAKETGKRVGCETVVPNPAKLAIIYASVKKTDREDALKLARLISIYKDEQLPGVPVPGDKEMGRRKIIAAYNRAKQDRTRKINLLHGLFLHQGITHIVKKDLATAGKREDAVLLLKGFEKKESEYVLKVIDLAEKRLEGLKKEMDGETKDDKDAEILRTVPGVGPLVSFAFLAYLGDTNRFDNASQVSNYFGLVPKVDISCSIVRYGGITKRGNGIIRGLLVQSAWSIVRSNNGGALRERFEYFKGHNASRKKTIVGIARRLAELMYTMMKTKKEYTARKFIPPGRGTYMPGLSEQRNPKKQAGC